MKRIAIERKQGISATDFARDHLDGHGKPVIITDAMDRWEARSKWDFQYLKAAYGSDFVTASFGLMSDVGKLTKLGTYIDYLDAPGEELPGFWVASKDGKPLRTEPAAPLLPPYLQGWYGFQKHPELYDDIAPAPGFISDWQLAFSPVLREVFEWTCGKEYFSIYIGPEGALSQLHQDFWHTHAYLAQIRGRKKCLLFSPQDSGYLYDGEVNPEQPDFVRFKLFEQATMYECEIEPGEMLYIPPDWWHHVRGLDKNITVSHNFFNETNANEHLTGILRKLPTLVDGFDQSPSFREKLNIHWRSRGFLDTER